MNGQGQTRSCDTRSCNSLNGEVSLNPLPQIEIWWRRDVFGLACHSLRHGSYGANPSGKDITTWRDSDLGTISVTNQIQVTVIKTDLLC